MTTNKATTKKQTFAERLLIAQEEASGIGKDSNNAYHKYAYTDCDSMIDYGGRILNLSGLVLYPKECEHESSGNMIVVKKVFICETVEGEQREIPIEVPVVSTDRKQADDKASFASQSSGLAYMMRDLLLIPRGDKFVDIDGTPKTEVCSEDDTKFVKTTAPKDKPTSKPANKTKKVAVKTNKRFVPANDKQNVAIREEFKGKKRDESIALRQELLRCTNIKLPEGVDPETFKLVAIDELLSEEGAARFLNRPDF